MCSIEPHYVCVFILYTVCNCTVCLLVNNCNRNFTNMEVTKKPVFIRHSDLRVSNDRHLNLTLYEIIDGYIPHSTMAAQHIGGLWYICTKTDAARQHLLTKVVTIRFKSQKIELHDNNPFTSPRTPSEKIIIKDLPPHIPSDDIIEFHEQKHPHILTRSGAILARIPSRTNTLTEYYSGDRVVYAK